MAVIRPFRALRPAEQVAQKVAALPYDVYGRAEAREAAAKEPLSFLNIDRPETQFSPEQDMYAPEVYETAARMLSRQKEEGVYCREEAPCYYLYRLTMGDRSQTGLVACASIDDYCGGVIKKHENTREEKEQDRIRHVDVCSAQTGPIFLAYRGRKDVEEIVRQETGRKPLYDFVSEDGIRHTVFRIAEEETIARLTKAFGELGEIYIADGHHRAASAVKVGLARRAAAGSYTGDEEFNYFLAVLFPEQELQILPYYRVVRDLNGLTMEELLERAAESFEVTVCDTPVEPRCKGEFGMYGKETWYRLVIRPELAAVADPVEALDVSLLQKYLLAPVLGIVDPRTDKRIDFVGGIRGIAELERRVHTDMALAFSTYPTSMEELLAVADAGLLMPPKSTWFEPKLRSGLFLHEI